MVFGDLETTSAVTENGKKVLTMTEYIEREDLLELYRMDDPVLNENGHVPLSVIRQNIMDIPAADVAPVRHGRWLDRPKNQGLKDEEIGTVGMVYGEPWSSCYCSECGEWLVASDEYAVKGNYCANCGAKMDGGED